MAFSPSAQQFESSPELHVLIFLKCSDKASHSESDATASDQFVLDVNSPFDIADEKAFEMSEYAFLYATLYSWFCILFISTGIVKALITPIIPITIKTSANVNAFFVSVFKLMLFASV